MRFLVSKRGFLVCIPKGMGFSDFFSVGSGTQPPRFACLGFKHYLASLRKKTRKPLLNWLYPNLRSYALALPEHIGVDAEEYEATKGYHTERDDRRYVGDSVDRITESVYHIENGINLRYGLPYR